MHAVEQPATQPCGAGPLHVKLTNKGHHEALQCSTMPDAKAKHIHGRPRQLICAALLNSSAFEVPLTVAGQLKCAALELMDVN